jgi:hypothetical protein
MSEIAADAGHVICANPDCRVAEDGKCVEGFEIDSCPHYGHAAGAIDDWGVGEEVSAVTTVLALPSADTLTPSEVGHVLRAGDARIIAIIGPTDAGKTSLIASLYDLFQEAPIDGVEFARSLSLHAFERACHDARAASRRSTPHMNRTPRGEVRFYHLDIGGGAAGDGLTLALGDRAGEEYREAADNPSVTPAFPEIRRADSLTLLVDGERLVDPGARHNLRADLIMIVQGLIDGGALTGGQRLALVLTKLDVVQLSSENSRAKTDFSHLFGDFRRLFGNIFSTIQAFEIAASPKSDAVPRGTGIPAMLLFWLTPAKPAPTRVPRRPAFRRLFARLRPLDELEEDA